MASTRLSTFDDVVWGGIESGQSPDIAKVLDGLTNASEPRVQLAVETLFTDDGHPFDSIIPTGMYSVVREGSGTLEALRLLDKDGEWLLLALATGDVGVFHLLSAVPRTDSRWERVERWITRAKGLSRCFLNHDDFSSIGDRLSEFGRVEVVKVAARVVKDGSSINRGFPMRDAGDRPNHADEIHEIEELGASIRTLTLHVGDALDVRLRRVAGATFLGGSFRIFRSQVLGRLESAAAARRQLLSGRARQEGSADVTSVTVGLGSPLMESAEDTGDVLDVISRMPDYTMAVFHRNPYLHFVVTDEHDGSNFDVLITRSDAIDIYPGFRSTASSLARVSQRLGEAFGALSIGDSVLPAEAVSLYDLR